MVNGQLAEEVFFYIMVKSRVRVELGTDNGRIRIVINLYDKGKVPVRWWEFFRRRYAVHQEFVLGAFE